MSLAAHFALAAATLLCALVAGFLFAFAVVVMPGLARLGDREFLRAFQEIDGVIQRGQPVFGLVWLGSVLTLLAALFLAFGRIDGTEQLLLVASTGLYLFGVQFPTIRINIPLNNEVQAIDLAVADEAACRRARVQFEGRWNRWNIVRAVMSVFATAGLVALLCRL